MGVPCSTWIVSPSSISWLSPSSGSNRGNTPVEIALGDPLMCPISRVELTRLVSPVVEFSNTSFGLFRTPAVYPSLGSRTVYVRCVMANGLWHTALRREGYTYGEMCRIHK